MRPVREPALIAHGCHVAFGPDDDVGALDLVPEGLGLDERTAEGHLRHVHERDRRGDSEDFTKVFPLERVVESARVAQSGGFDDEAVGFGASEELGDRDGERRGDGAAEAPAGDLPDDDPASLGVGVRGVRLGEPRRGVQHGAVDSESAELVHHDAPSLV